jgi:CRISPR-associated exonuclease Cas4
VLFYHACLPDIRPLTYKMEAGIEAHEKQRVNAARRSLNTLGILDGKRNFDVKVIAPLLGLSGEIDEVIEVTAPRREFVPVDYKLTRKVGYHFIVQVAAYAMMLEEYARLPVHRGYIYLIPLHSAQEVAITASLRNSVRRALEEMRIIVQHEAMPEPTEYVQKCAGCEFRRFCNDVL